MMRWRKGGCILDPAKISMMVSQSHIVSLVVLLQYWCVKEWLGRRRKVEVEAVWWLAM